MRTVLYITPLLVACGGPVEDAWGPTRKTCGLLPGETHDYPMEAPPEDEFILSDNPLTYSEACARAIGDDLGVTWDDFPDAELPGMMNGDVLEKAIAGAWMLLAGDFGTVGAMLSDPAAPPTYRDELAEAAEDVGADDEDPASRILYDWVAHHVESTVLREDEPVIAFDRPDGALLLWAMPPEGEVYPGRWVEILVHEAYHHRRGSTHVDCDTGESVAGGQDDSWDSASGAGAFSFLLHYRELPEDLPRGIRDASERTIVASMDFCPGTEVPDEVPTEYP